MARLLLYTLVAYTSLLYQWTLAFHQGVLPPLTPKPSSSCRSRLWGKVKRGQLGRTVDADAATTASSTTRKSKKTSSSSSSSSTGNAKSANISPALAEWMANKQEQQSAENIDDDDTRNNAATSSSPPTTTTTTTTTKKQKQKRPGRIKQSVRKAAEDARDERVETWVKGFQELLLDSGTASGGGTGTTVDDIVARVRELVELVPTGNFKQLSASTQQQDFRLAWVGSDDAVTHVGTGLHKVPLARLQEVFLSFVGRNRVEIQEVIRILGPFPNVKNTLLGQSTFTRGGGGGDDKTNIVEWNLTWDSMVDGTGKEILAGKEENQQRVHLHVYFSSPSVVVAVVPPDSENMSVYRPDPWENQGQHVLVFVREDNLLDELDKLRVA